MGWGWIILALGGAVAVAAGFEAYVKRGQYRPLSRLARDQNSSFSHKAKPTEDKAAADELGLEATDLKAFDDSLRVSQQTQLAHGGIRNGFSTRMTAPNSVRKFKDDETYARRFLKSTGKLQEDKK